MKPNRWRWWIVVAGGVGALVLAVGAIVLEFTPPALTVFATDAIVLGFGALAIGLGLLALFGAPARRDHDVPFPPPDPDDETADFEHVTETIDASLERHRLGDDRFERGKRSRQRHEARTAIRRTAIDVLAACHNVSADDAATRIRDGTWTEDPRAAAFLSTSVTPPLRLRIVDWMFGMRYHRGLEAAVEEISRLDTDQLAVETGGDRP
ncbi:DUF7269 family protein [Natronoglomus mannanivorans]|uniref:Uncharacterized protein n=1 Tax=Natronoglomus mannanivorans TaxID=2979990 RepID=A0AAP2Z2U4_9EURY|nr:hypothetical protein [Halobacteria archaeon AArc-xg1-1]